MTASLIATLIGEEPGLCRKPQQLKQNEAHLPPSLPATKQPEAIGGDVRTAMAMSSGKATRLPLGCRNQPARSEESCAKSEFNSRCMT